MASSDTKWVKLWYESLIQNVSIFQHPEILIVKIQCQEAFGKYYIRLESRSEFRTQKGVKYPNISRIPNRKSQTQKYYNLFHTIWVRERECERRRFSEVFLLGRPEVYFTNLRVSSYWGLLDVGVANLHRKFTGIFLLGSSWIGRQQICGDLLVGVFLMWASQIYVASLRVSSYWGRLELDFTNLRVSSCWGLLDVDVANLRRKFTGIFLLGSSWVGRHKFTGIFLVASSWDSRCKVVGIFLVISSC